MKESNIATPQLIAACELPAAQQITVTVRLDAKSSAALPFKALQAVARCSPQSHKTVPANALRL